MTLPLNKSLSEEISKNDAPLPKSREMKTVHGPPPREMKTIHRQKSVKEMNTLHEVKPSSAMSQPSPGKFICIICSEKKILLSPSFMYYVVV